MAGHQLPLLFPQVYMDPTPQLQCICPKVWSGDLGCVGSVRLLSLSDPQFSHLQYWNTTSSPQAAMGAECGDVNRGPCMEWYVSARLLHLEKGLPFCL